MSFGKKMEVLHISNVNSIGAIVLNDEKLLELIMQYPWLYSPRLETYDDEDYKEWAWEQITNRFNRNYESVHPGKEVSAFSEAMLKERWDTLRPMLCTLSKLFDISSIPISLRETVMHIGTKLQEDVAPPGEKTCSAAQLIIAENLKMVEKLPLEQRRCMEAEIMEFILSCEIETKGTIAMGAAEKALLEQECKEFLTAIRFNITEAFKDCSNSNSPVNITENSPATVQSNISCGAVPPDPTHSPLCELGSEGKDVSPEASSNVEDVAIKMEIVEPVDQVEPVIQRPITPIVTVLHFTCSKSSKSAAETTSPATPKSVKPAAHTPNKTPVVKIKRERLLRTSLLKGSPAKPPQSPSVSDGDTLLEPMAPTKFIPLALAMSHVRPCVVRIKRVRCPPLKIKRERIAFIT